ncbi:MAG: hypothetical protein Q9167_000625 [Letrouitia subvulpina]
MKSRWTEDEGDPELDAQRKREKEEKKKAKAEKQKQLQAIEGAQKQANTDVAADGSTFNLSPAQAEQDRPAKRRKLSPEPDAASSEQLPNKLLRFPRPEWGPSRHVNNFERLNHIEEGSYGWVSRSKEIATGEIVAVKKLKMDASHDGFPVTGLREIQILKASKHPHIVALREVVMGDELEE